MFKVWPAGRSILPSTESSPEGGGGVGDPPHAVRAARRTAANVTEAALRRGQGSVSMLQASGCGVKPALNPYVARKRAGSDRPPAAAAWSGGCRLAPLLRQARTWTVAAEVVVVTTRLEHHQHLRSESDGPQAPAEDGLRLH